MQTDYGPFFFHLIFFLSNTAVAVPIHLTMTGNISEISAADAERIIRTVDYPAIQDSPLFRLTFPSHATTTEAQQNEIIQWYTEGLKNALKCKTYKLIQICALDGTPLGLCGWTTEQRRQQQQQQQQRMPTNTSPAQLGRKPPSLLEVLDFPAWVSVSNALRSERERILSGVDHVCRK